MPFSYISVFRAGCDKFLLPKLSRNPNNRLFLPLGTHFLEENSRIGTKARYQQNSLFALQVRMIPFLPFAITTDVPNLFNELFATLPPESYDLASIL